MCNYLELNDHNPVRIIKSSLIIFNWVIFGQQLELHTLSMLLHMSCNSANAVGVVKPATSFSHYLCRIVCLQIFYSQVPLFDFLCIFK
ncbi:hypothetical protein FKM82_023959 [Ascaphus truei]